MGQIGPLRDLGPCKVYWGTLDSEVLIGDTHGGVIFTLTNAIAPVHEDAKGVTVIDDITIGLEACEVKAPFTRLTLEKLSSVLVGAGYATGSGSGDNLLHGSADVGRSAVAGAASLILKPIVNNVVSTTSQEWLHLPLSYPSMHEIEVNYDADNQRVYSVTFKGYPKTGTIGGTSYDIHWHIGDDAQITWS